MSEDEFVEAWLNKNWRKAPSNAFWVNIQNHNVSAMNDNQNPGKWKARLVKPGQSPADAKWLDDFASKRGAQVAILKELFQLLHRE